MNSKPVIPVNHAARAASSLVIAFGVLAEALQHAAPELQRIFPDVKWLAPTIMLIGFAWSSVQKVQDAQKQAATL